MSSVDPAAEELLEAAEDVRTTLEELRVAEAELAQQNEDLQAAQWALAAEADRYRLLFESAPVAYVTTDRAGAIREANRAAMELLDLRFPRGKPLANVVELEQRRPFRTWLRERVAADGTDERAWRLRHRSGVLRDVEISVTATEDELLWAIADVTDRTHAEEHVWALNRALEQQAAEQAGEVGAVFEEMPYGVVLVDAGTRRVRRANVRATEILGPIVGSPLERLQRADMDGAPLPAERLPGKRALDGETVAPERVRITRDDGTERVLDMGALPLRDAAGTIVAAAVTLDDVTVRYRREQADRAFIVNSAHQLRTPITAIASAVAALEAGAKKKPAEREHFLAHIARETDRMTRLVESLLILARLQRDGSTPALSVVPLAPLLRQACAEVSPAEGVTIRVEADEDVGCVTNQGLLLEVVVNLVTNAVTHTTEGEIVLRALLDDDDDDDDDYPDHAVVEVADTGPGVAPEDRELVFERFFRTADGRKGAGLGLAIAVEAMRALRGQIELVDTPAGSGATFRLRLPGATILP
jgi:PAS domain S-box-containing protein